MKKMATDSSTKPKLGIGIVRQYGYLMMNNREPNSKSE